VVNQTASVNNAWEKWSDNTWHNIQSAWSMSTGQNMGLAAVITGSLVSTFLSDEGWIRLLQIFPNPSNGNITLNIGLDNFRNINISVTNLLGKEVYRTSLENYLTGMHTLDLSALNSGVYFLSIQSGENTHTEKIIIRN
ncbi:MAG: T9SS type A sorting domain-containing protein, partial [Bacteroidia bacterium]|nr:T9SS type A sorting domain-containing protein [Bacteroidia bacterium]